VYRDFLEEAELAEELGFDAVWASEHHFSPDAWSPSPVPFLAAVAARTQRIRIGTYVLLLPLHNPVRIAEDFAVLDNISGGRVDLPVGVGSATEEFHTFGVPFGERLGRMFEGLTVIERCFTGEKFSHHGKYYDFPDVHMTTPTVQQPGPPIWVASMGEQSVRRTARRGYHLAAGAARGHALYEQQLRPEAGSIGSGALERLPPVGEFRNVPGIGHGGAPFAVGTSETVAEMLSIYRNKRLTHLVLTFHAPGMASEAVQRSMRTFARDIMPAVAAW
jgi:alkanesulfonate monooxygenase SsuD/methylene tetrahydromethanopterin reductase-like flavin-dependent oxidoreductase (luciferase family)